MPIEMPVFMLMSTRHTICNTVTIKWMAFTNRLYQLRLKKVSIWYPCIVCHWIGHSVAIWKMVNWKWIVHSISNIRIDCKLTCKLNGVNCSIAVAKANKQIIIWTPPSNFRHFCFCIFKSWFCVHETPIYTD